MPRKHFAKSIVSRPNIAFDEWMEELRNQHEGAVPRDHVHRIAKTVLRKCDPKQYLLSHATIVASVDAFAPKGVKLGRSMNRGVQVDVRWPDFRIKPECLEIVNNNGDAWERSLLLSTYRTFIGAPNYLEHIQLPELSKGFIVDAIARDLGKSCYIDILVATDRKHATLIQDILSGKIDSMSMGCISLFTLCSRCGNVAADDTQLCPCVQYDGKGSRYTDEDGVSQIVSELIGHVSVPNSNQFIEASWVRNPAFRGAVRRNILNPDSTQLASRIEDAHRVYEVRTDVPLPDGVKKAASLRRAQGEQDQGGGEQQLDTQMDLGDEQDQGGADQAQGGADQAQGGADQGQTAPSAPKPEKFDELLEKAQEGLLELFVKNLGERLQPKPEDVGSVRPAPVDLHSGNESLVNASAFEASLRKGFPGSPKLVKWAVRAHRIVHQGGPRAIRAAGFTSKDLIVLSWIEDRCRGRSYPAALYELAMQVGPLSNFPSAQSFLATCRMRAGRDLSSAEQQFMTWKGRIASVAKF